MKRRLLICVLELDETKLSTDNLPRRRELSSLPDRLATVIDRVAPNSLGLEAVYLLDEKVFPRVEEVLEVNCEHFHRYAVSVRREICVNAQCAIHGEEDRKVVKLHDRFPDHPKPKRHRRVR